MKQISLLATTAFSLLATPAFALDDAAIMKQLQAMQQQISTLQGQVETLSKELTTAKERAASAEKSAANSAEEARLAKLQPAAGAPVVVAAKPKEPSGDDVKITMSPAPKFETADGNFVFKVGGLGQIDAGVFNDDRRDHSDGTNIRRARVNASGTVYKDWKYKLEADFAGNATALTDVYLEYAGIEGLSLMAGQFKEPFMLENLASDPFTTFNERSLPVVFAPERNIGFAATVNGETPLGYYTASAGVFGANSGTASTDDESRDFTGRVTWAPIATGTEVLHLGAAYSRRIPDSATDTIRLQSRAENRISSAQAVDTGNITSVDDSNLYGLELAGVYGPFSLQGEYIMQSVERSGTAETVDLSGYYAEASYFLTGESRTYAAASGKFDRVTTKWPFNWKEGNWGAWQVAARYSSLDLTDLPIAGGEVTDITLALKWLPTSFTMISANYIMVNSDKRAVTANDEPDIFLLRAQFDF